jgi:hypothetical protein
MDIVFSILHFVSPPGNPIIPHLLRYQGFAVAYYGFTLGCLEYGAFSAFAHLRFKIPYYYFPIPDTRFLLCVSIKT